MDIERNIGERIRQALAECLKRPVETIAPSHSLRQDLGLTSVDTFELFFLLEDDFHIEIPDEDLHKLITVADVIAYVERRLTPHR